MTTSIPSPQRSMMFMVMRSDAPKNIAPSRRSRAMCSSPGAAGPGSVSRWTPLRWATALKANTAVTTTPISMASIRSKHTVTAAVIANVSAAERLLCRIRLISDIEIIRTAVTISTQVYTDGTSTDDPHLTTVPAQVVEVGPGIASLQAVLPPSVVAKAGLKATTVGLDISQPHLTEGQEKSLDADLLALPTPATISVERGYQASDDVVILQWLLFLMAAVLMLGGTLTAMFLALSDARPDLATLSAVGAEARVRRKVAASYTFVVAFVGAVLGMLVGFVPGIAVTWPLTSHNYLGAGPFLDIPWALIAAVVVGLPIVTALTVGACVRSKLPMVSRLS